MPSASYVDENTKTWMKRMFRKFIRSPKYQPKRSSQPLSVSQSPEVYIAKTPAEGIPARGSDKPGVATCSISIIKPDKVPPQLFDAQCQKAKVFNLTCAHISSSSRPYVIVTRDKDGRFILEGDIGAATVRLEFGGATPAGSLIAAGTGGIFGGFLSEWSATGLTDTNQVWIRFIDWDDSDSGVVIGEQGRYYQGQCAGEFDSAGDKRPLYLCTLGEQTFIGKPTTTFADGATATFDLYEGPEGAESPAGISMDAVVRGGSVQSTKYYAVSRIRGGAKYAFVGGAGGGADIVLFQVPDDRLSTEDSFNVTYLASLGDRTPTLTAGEFDVWDGNYMFPKAVTNAFGFAVYNKVLDRWDVLYCEQMCIYARATVNTLGGYYGTADVPIDNFQALGFSLYTLPPSTIPISAKNSRSHIGRDNDPVWLMYDFASGGGWEIIDSPNRGRKWIVTGSGNTGGKVVKGAAGTFVVQNGPDATMSVTAEAIYAELVDGKLCFMWQDDDGTYYVGPGECQ